MSETETRCGMVALVGAPNAGKSTLTNTLVGAKVAIVSAKKQTTRARLIGVAMHDQSQILLVDTPGIFVPKRRLDRSMVTAAWGGAQDADVIGAVIDADRGLTADVRAMLEKLQDSQKPKFAILNKVDVADKGELLKRADALQKLGTWNYIFMVSARSGEGVADLKAALARAVPPGPWHYPEDQLSNITQRMMAAEMTREQLFNLLDQELPYAAAVETENWEQRRDGSAAIHQVIYVERESQKRIVVGNGGHQIKTIGANARAEMEKSFGHRVHLFVHVKVKEDWADNRDVYRGIGQEWSA